MCFSVRPSSCLCCAGQSRAAAMHVDSAFLMCAVIFAALWRGSWAASPVPSIPDQLQAVVGSCVVIPCSFTPPAPHSFWTRRKRVEVKMKFRGRNPFFLLLSTAFNSEDRSQTNLDYLGRTSLFGETSDGDCSVKIERVRQEDARVFEIALKRSGDSGWGKARSFTLDVLDTPEAPVITGLSAATEGQHVTLNCSVSYHCPSAPPTLRWIWERGAPWNDSEPGEVETLLPDPHRPMLLTSLSFIATPKVKPRFRCEARHPGGNALATLKNLHVTFSPKDVVVQVHTLMVQEGGSALLVCSCKADPPASEYRWSYSQHGRVVHLHQRTQTIRVFNVTRDMSVRCSAQNLIGRGQSRPMQLDIHYKPVILQLSSSCDVQDMDVLCRCSVESNPKAAVTWSVNGSIPPDDYNISMASEPYNLTVILQGRMDRPQRVVCFAVNALGNDSLVLLQGEEDTASLLWMVIPAAATCLVLFLLSLLFFCCCRRRAGRQVLSQRPAMYPGEMGIYQDQMPLYINCTEVTHIYTNGSYQLVYQNCTPVFVNTKQTRPIGRRRGERRREGGRVERHGVSGVRNTGEAETAAVGDADTGIYLEIL